MSGGQLVTAHLVASWVILPNRWMVRPSIISWHSGLRRSPPPEPADLAVSGLVHCRTYDGPLTLV